MTAKKLTTFEQVKKEVLTALEKNGENDDIFTALGTPISDERREELHEHIKTAIIESKRKTDLVKAAARLTSNIREFIALVVVMVATDTKATAMSEHEMRMKLFEALTK